MKKFQIIKCKTCGEVIAACIDKYADASWYRSVIKHLKTENATVETIETDKNVFGDNELNPCCGKKITPKFYHN